MVPACIHAGTFVVDTGFLGVTPSVEALAGLPTFGDKADKQVTDTQEDSPVAKLAQRTSSLMALLNTSEGMVQAKAARVWLGEGLGSIPKRTYNRIMRWECIDMAELCHKAAWERTTKDGGDTEKLVVLPGLVVTQEKQEPVTNILTWLECYAKFTAAVAKEFPESTPGLMSHQLTILKAYKEAEEPAWRRYDEAFREKMAATKNRLWSGRDVSLYQEICGSQTRRKSTGTQLDKSGNPGRNRKRPNVCWQFNDGQCSFGKKCKFPHECSLCLGPHPKSRCLADRRPRI